MKQTLFLLLIAGVVMLLSFHHKTIVGQQPYKDNPEFLKILADFEKQLRNDNIKDSTGSISAVVFKGDEIIRWMSVGKANNQKYQNADSNTVYCIGSISKTITSYLMMLMVQNGTIRLDESISKYVHEIKQLKPDGKNKGDDITFRQLASHTSGLENEPDSIGTTPLGRTEDWKNILLSLIPTTGFHFPIGERYWYSNFGYGILGLAISRAANKPFIDLVNEQVFHPHGMKNSFYVIPQGYEDQIASGYHWYPSSETYSTEFADKQRVGRSYKVPPGGVFSTANDLARFAMALTADSDMLGKNYRDSMRTEQTSVRQSKGEGYGLGLFIAGENKGIKKIGHSGQVAGFCSRMIFDPETRIGIVILGNRDNLSAAFERKTNILLMELVKARKTTD